MRENIPAGSTFGFGIFSQDFQATKPDLTTGLGNFAMLRDAVRAVSTS